MRCAFRRENLGQHATAPQARTRAARHGFEFRRARVSLFDQRGRGIAAWIGGKQATLIGEDNQRVAFYEIRYQRAERVVVAKLDFVGDDGVVFIDDWHATQPQQGEQR
jgi:hypothetical protein